MFLFICLMRCISSLTRIQIHLMFLFIMLPLSFSMQPTSFKYISCSYLSRRNLGNVRRFIIQIHLMFLFIADERERRFRFHIQIHLMFLFIILHRHSPFFKSDSNTSHVLIYHRSRRTHINHYQNSNTSHVLIYPALAGSPVSRKSNSNTSHVLIYPVSSIWFWDIVEFKYISCSYLSTCRIPLSLYYDIQIHLMFLFISFSKPSYESFFDSNTSHVLIYPTPSIRSANRVIPFKYISCSYLSPLKDSQNSYRKRFKYISCSYLSVDNSVVEYSVL